MSARQSQQKERILTQPEPAKVRQTNAAVVVKHGSLFLLTTDAGDVPWKLPHGLGLFFHDCRFLDGYTLTLNGRDLTVLSGVGPRGFASQHQLANPALSGDDEHQEVKKNTIVIRRQHVIRNDVLQDQIVVRNYGHQPAALRLDIRFRAKFEDLFVLKGFVSHTAGKRRPPRVLNGDTVELSYDGSDGLCRTTTLTFDPPPTTLEPDCATIGWTLDPGDHRMVTVRIVPAEHRSDRRQDAERARKRGPATSMHWLERSEGIWLERSTSIRASSELFERVLRRSLLDLRILRSRLHGLHYFAAGIPWFATLFGRDAATVAIQTLPYGPSIARETLCLLARYQATAIDAYRDAEPGKILHELRHGELANTGAIPQSPAYYGTVDATPLFLILLGDYVSWTGDLDLVRRLRPHVDAALRWMDQYGDHDGDGYLDYSGEHPNGLVNQGWKDSGIAIVDADGSLAKPPIALCEVQGYAFRAWRETATVIRALGDTDAAARLDQRADAMRERFERDFWSDQLGCYVLARQQHGRPAAVVASNTGQVLWSGIASTSRAERVAERLLATDMFTGWGIRTLSSREVAYNPVSYHLGSVWPHDNAIIAVGMRRYGLDQQALQVFDAVFLAASQLQHFRLPELYCGFDKVVGDVQPVRYPVACSPQAWASGSLPHGLWGLLGLHGDALNGRLRIVRPHLPSGVDWLELRGLRVGSARANLRFERAGRDGQAEVTSEVLEGDLTVDVSRQLPRPDQFGSTRP